MKEELKKRVLGTFLTIQICSQRTGIEYTKLSKYLNGYKDLTGSEKNRLRLGLGIGWPKFNELADGVIDELS